MTLPDLASFDDFRDFLGVIIAQESRVAGKVSLDRFASAFGMSRSALSMLLSGKRPLSQSGLHRVARALRLDESDHEIFEALVFKCQAEDDETRAYYERKLAKQRARRRTQTLSTPSRTLVSEWYVPALLVYLIDVSDAPDDLRAFAGRLGLGDDELNAVLDALRSEGFLAYKGRGNVNIAFNRVAAMVSTQKYLRAVHAEGIRQAERRFSDPLCFFAAHCFSVAEADVEAFVAEYKGILSKYMSSVPSGDRGTMRVVQVNLQFFPVGD